jgi:hypothetical protein
VILLLCFAPLVGLYWFVARKVQVIDN